MLVVAWSLFLSGIAACIELLNKKGKVCFEERLLYVYVVCALKDFSCVFV